ncbi:hypothetical protein [Novosphingobium sp. Chol11]|uniref:hypothetical protein n=1 Tax=Novosphingobium sp. Chol11 TaxID=1385763 RepID=UPI000BE225F6|nr:hypothetical protein [Novosphingobium sp. Chol11]
MAISDALAHLDDALDALTLEAYRGAGTDSMERVAPIQATLAIELERIDMALGPRGQSMFAPIAEEIKRAVIAIVAAKESLGDRA